MALPHDPPPASLRDNGTHRFGTYSAAISHINPLRDHSKLAARLDNFRLKEWEAFQLGNDEWFLCGAVYDTKTLGLLQIIAVHLPTKRIIRWLQRVPTWKLHVARGLSGTSTSGQSNRFSIRMDNDVPDGTIYITATHQRSAKLPQLQLDISGRCSDTEAGHLVIVHPFSDTTALYSHKAMMPASATMTIDDERIDFDSERSFLLLDDHKGQYPSPMKYDWVTGATRTNNGGVLGFNLTANQIQNPELYNENAIFLDNSVHRLGPVTFERPNGVDRPWHITDTEGRVDVWFSPDVSSEIHVGPRRLLAEYFGPYGTFTGTLRDNNGDKIDIAGIHGMGEQKLIRV